MPAVGKHIGVPQAHNWCAWGVDADVCSAECTTACAGQQQQHGGSIQCTHIATARPWRQLWGQLGQCVLKSASTFRSAMARPILRHKFCLKSCSQRVQNFSAHPMQCWSTWVRHPPVLQVIPSDSCHVRLHAKKGWWTSASHFAAAPSKIDELGWDPPSAAAGRMR